LRRKGGFASTLLRRRSPRGHRRAKPHRPPTETGPSGRLRLRLRKCLHSSFASDATSRPTERTARWLRFRRVTNDEVQDRETASYAYELLERLASLAGKSTAPSENKYAREAISPSTAKPPIKSRATSAKEGSPVHAVITKIDRMKTRQGDSLFLKVRSKPGWNSIFPAW